MIVAEIIHNVTLQAAQDDLVKARAEIDQFRARAERAEVVCREIAYWLPQWIRNYRGRPILPSDQMGWPLLEAMVKACSEVIGPAAVPTGAKEGE